MLLRRKAEQTIRRVLEGFPVVAVTGPRQSGKTTLVKSMFPERPYVSLEDPDELSYSIEDPRLFLDRFPDGAIIDDDPELGLPDGDYPLADDIGAWEDAASSPTTPSWRPRPASSGGFGQSSWSRSFAGISRPMWRRSRIF